MYNNNNKQYDTTYLIPCLCASPSLVFNFSLISLPLISILTIYSDTDILFTYILKEFCKCCVMKEWTIVCDRVKDDCNIFQLHLILFVVFVYNYVERK